MVQLNLLGGLSAFMNISLSLEDTSNHVGIKSLCILQCVVFFFSFLRLQAYDVVKIWCGIAKQGSSIADHAQQYIDLSLSDIYSEKDSISLSVS